MAKVYNLMKEVDKLGGHQFVAGFCVGRVYEQLIHILSTEVLTAKGLVEVVRGGKVDAKETNTLVEELSSKAKQHYEEAKELINRLEIKQYLANTHEIGLEEVDRLYGEFMQIYKQLKPSS